MKLKIKLNGEVSELDVKRQGDRLLVKQDQHTSQLEIIQQNRNELVLVITDSDTGERRQLRTAGTFLDNTHRQLWLNGQTFTYERLPTHAGTADHDTRIDASLSASIPAVVTEILVKVGDIVAANDKLILLESMKMVIPIQAPHAGIVRQLNCTAGDAVQPGTPLIELDTLQE